MGLLKKEALTIIDNGSAGESKASFKFGARAYRGFDSNTGNLSREILYLGLSGSKNSEYARADLEAIGTAVHEFHAGALGVIKFDTVVPDGADVRFHARGVFAASEQTFGANAGLYRSPSREFLTADLSLKRSSSSAQWDTHISMSGGQGGGAQYQSPSGSISCAW